MCVKKTTNKQTKQMCKKSSQTSQEQLVSELQTSFYYHHFGSDITWNQHLFCVCVASIFCNICVWVGPRQFGQVNVWCVTTKMLVKWGWHIMFFKMYALIESYFCRFSNNVKHTVLIYTNFPMTVPGCFYFKVPHSFTIQ